MTAYLYLNCFIPADSTCESVIVPQNPLKVKPDVAVIGALLYAFSGFQTINLEFNHFHDVVAVFPLLLWGIENIDEKKKRPAFIIAVAINCLINYFFFIQSVVFMLIYFIVILPENVALLFVRNYRRRNSEHNFYPLCFVYYWEY